MPADSSSRIADADIDASPLHAARVALLTGPSAETFAAVCDALADLADAGEEIDRERFLDAVDRAQSLAEAAGLVRSIGQDEVQAVMAQAFRRCRVHHRPPIEPIEPIEPPARRDDEAADTTVEALVFSLRERGAAALSERACLDRLANLSSDQIRDVIKRLTKLRPRYPKVTDELILKLGELL